MLTNETAKHLLYVEHHGIQVQDSRFQHLLAAESQKLASQRGSASPCLRDLLTVFVPGVTLGQAFL